jgi:hypothetical protein
VSKRWAWIDVVGAVFGLVVIGATAFAALSIFGRGPAALAWPGRQAGVAESITEGLGRGLREGLRAVRPVAGTWTNALKTSEEMSAV